MLLAPFSLGSLPPYFSSELIVVNNIEFIIDDHYKIFTNKLGSLYCTSLHCWISQQHTLFVIFIFDRLLYLLGLGAVSGS